MKKNKKIEFRKQRTHKNNLLSDKLIYTGNSNLKTELHFIQYNEEHIEFHTLKSVEELATKRKKDYICWVQVCGLSDIKLISDIQHYFDLHILEVQDILNNDHIPKIEEYENNILLIAKALSVDENNELRKEQISFVLGNYFLLNFQETNNIYFDNIQKALRESNVKARKQSVDYLLSLLLRNVCDGYSFYIDQVEDSLEEMETTLMGFDQNQADIGRQIQLLRKQYLSLKKAIIPLKESFSHFLHSNSNILNSADMAYVNDTYDHLLMVTQKIDICREIISSLLDLYISNNDLRMNEIMKQLTVVGSIFIPLTFVVGVWGMNFTYMPELSWKYGYLFAWILMGVIGIAGWIYFKFKKWN